MKPRQLFALAALVLTVGACEDDDDDGSGPEPARSFTATLNGANEKPNPVTTNGTGTATFTLDAAETTLTYTVNVTGLGSNINNQHIHIGNANFPGGVIVGLTAFPAATAGTSAGTITSATALGQGLTFPSLIALMRNGDAYVNVHTVNNPGGEVRGQLRPTT